MQEATTTNIGTNNQRGGEDTSSFAAFRLEGNRSPLLRWVRWLVRREIGGDGLQVLRHGEEEEGEDEGGGGVPFQMK